MVNHHKGGGLNYPGGMARGLVPTIYHQLCAHRTLDEWRARQCSHKSYNDGHSKDDNKHVYDEDSCLTKEQS